MVGDVPYIEINDLTFHYRSEEPLLRSISAHCAQLSTTFLTGANGAGKSTLVKLLIGLLAPQEGSIHVAGKLSGETPLHELAGNVAVSPQSAEHLIFSATVRKEIAFGPENLARPNADELAADALRVFSLTEFAERHPYDLHAAQRKLIALASAVAMDTPFLVFDEPTVGLSKTERDIFSKVLRLLRKRGKGYILITHDPAFGFQHCDRILILRDGRFAVDDSLSGFLLRANAAGEIKRANVQMPVASRLSRLFEQRPVATTIEEIIPFMKDRIHGH